MSNIQYRLKAYRRKGFGIHSPFAFHLITNVIESKLYYYAFSELKSTRAIAADQLKDLLNSKRSVKDIEENLRKEIKNLKSGEETDRLVFRLMNSRKAKSPLFIGNGLAYTCAYMAKYDSRNHINRVGNVEVYEDILNSVFSKELKISNFSIKDFNKVSLADFVVISDIVSINDLNSFRENFHNFLKKECCVVFFNLYKNEELLNCWRQLKEQQFFRLSLDMFHVGILIAREGMQKQDYVRKYRF